MDDIENVVFSGGSVKGIALCSAYIEFATIYERRYKTKLNDKIQSALGTSIGSCIALCVVCDVPFDHMKAIALDHFFFNLFEILQNIQIQRFLQHGGFLDHSILEHRIKLFLEKIGLPEDIDFITLYQKTKKKFICNTNIINSPTVTYLNHEETPFWKIKDALLASMCLPIFFQPFVVDDVFYQDGGIFENYCIHYFPSKKTIGFKIENDNDVHSYQNVGLQRTINLCSSMYNKINELQYEKMTNEQKWNTVEIKTPNIQALKIYVQGSEAEELWTNGIESVKLYFAKRNFVKNAVTNQIGELYKNKNLF